MERHVDTVLAAIRAVGQTLERGDLDRYRHRYAGGAALVLGMLEHGVLRGAPPGTGMRLLRLAAAEPRAYTVGEAVALIHQAGGVASLAHPAKIKRSQPLLSTSELRPLIEEGFDAVEAWQWIPGGWGSRHYIAVARDLGILVSGGSDDTANAPPTVPCGWAPSLCPRRYWRRSENGRWRFVQAERVGLNDRVGQQLRAHCFKRLCSPAAIRRAEPHLNQLPRADVLNPAKAKRAQSVPNRQPLWVIDRRF
jgi:hypothetical protein